MTPACRSRPRRERGAKAKAERAVNSEGKRHTRKEKKERLPARTRAHRALKCDIKMPLLSGETAQMQHGRLVADAIAAAGELSQKATALRLDVGRRRADATIEAGGKAVKEAVSKEEAEKIKGQLEEAGAEVELK